MEGENPNPAPYGYKADGTPRKFPAGPGRPKKAPGAPPDEHRDKTTYDPETLADIVVESVVSGKAVSKTRRAGEVKQTDRQVLARIAGESVEVFNERLAYELRDIAELASARIKEKLENDEFKTSELGFILSVAHDKRLTLDGSRALQGTQINQQINIITDKSSLLAELDGLAGIKNVTPPATT